MTEPCRRSSVSRDLWNESSLGGFGGGLPCALWFGDAWGDEHPILNRICVPGPRSNEFPSFISMCTPEPPGGTSTSEPGNSNKEFSSVFGARPLIVKGPLLKLICCALQGFVT